MNSAIIEKKKMINLFVVPHTHWDREWYLPFQQYRYLLIELIDQLLAILASNKYYRHFMLDGQAVTVNDYLAIRPKNRSKLYNEFTKGRLATGPWYLLADEFIISGESLIRNLMLGKRIASNLGQIRFEGYMPDSFGHTSQLPQILQGFGINTLIFARGMGNEMNQLDSEFLWRAPDGSTVLAHHLLLGYYNASTLRFDPNAGWQKDELPNNPSLMNLIETLLEKSSTNNVLLMNGGDHLRAQKNLPDILRSWNRNLPNNIVAKQVNLSEWIDQVRSQSPDLKTFNGEMRGSKTLQIFSGCLSSRMHLKQQNRETEDLLEIWAERISAFAWLEGRNYDKNQLWEAWKQLIRNQAHDSIGGCSIEPVCKEMEFRFNQSQQISEMILDEALQYLGNRVHIKGNDIHLLVFNPSNWPSDGEVTVPIDFLGNKRGYRFFGKSESKFDLGIDKMELINPTGAHIPFVKLGLQRRIKDVLDGCRVAEELRISFLAKNVPPHGYGVYRLTKKDIAHTVTEYSRGVRIGDRYLENKFYRIEVQKDGALRIKDKLSNKIFRDINKFENSCDRGDLYNFASLTNDKVISRPKRTNCKILENQGWKGVLEIILAYQLPAKISADRKSASNELINYEIKTQVTLCDDIKRIHIKTFLINSAKDHRLRVLFPSDLDVDYAWANVPFDVVKRNIELPEGEDWIEKPVATQPQRLFVKLDDMLHKSSFILAAKGLPEYEVLKNRGTIALTLLRSVGWMSRNDIDEVRRGGIRNIPVPEAQCLRDYKYDYILIPVCKSNVEEAYRLGVWQSTELKGKQVTNNPDGNLPEELSFMQVTPRSVIISAIKRAENNNGLIIRMFNPSLEDQIARCSFYRSVTSIKSLSLEEIPDNMDDITRVDGRTVKIPVRGKKIRTILITF